MRSDHGAESLAIDANGVIHAVDEYLDTALVETAAYGKKLVAP